MPRFVIILFSADLRAAAVHRDRHRLQFGARSLDRDRLLVGVGAHTERRRDDARHPQAEGIAAGAALDVAADAARGFRPGAGHGAVAVGGGALQFEVVAVAGAAERQVEARAGAVDVILGAAADALLVAVRRGDGAAARPGAGHGGEWAAGGLHR